MLPLPASFFSPELCDMLGLTTPFCFSSSAVETSQGKTEVSGSSFTSHFIQGVTLWLVFDCFQTYSTARTHECTIDLHNLNFLFSVREVLSQCPEKKNLFLSISHPMNSVKSPPYKLLQLSNEDHALFPLYAAWGRQRQRGKGEKKGSSHSILYFSISWTSAMDSRRSSVNFLRSWGLGALKLMRTLMSAPGIADVSRIPFG